METHVTAFSNSRKTDENVKNVQNEIDSNLENTAADEEETINTEAKYIANQ